MAQGSQNENWKIKYVFSYPLLRCPKKGKHVYVDTLYTLFVYTIAIKYRSLGDLEQGRT